MFGRKLGLLACLLVGTIAHSATAKSGDYLYSYQLGSQNWASVTAKNINAYVGSDNGKFYSLDLDRPKINWTFETQGKVRSKAAIKNHQVFFSSDDGYLYALNRWSGQQLWRVSLNDADVVRNLPANHAPWDFDYTKSSPNVLQNKLYIGSGDGNLYAINIDNGTEQWRFNTQGIIRSTPAVTEDQVIFGSWDGYVYALNRHNGELNWKFKTGAAVVSSPLLTNGQVIIGSRDTNLYSLDLYTGQQIWQYTFPGGSWIESSAIQGENNNLYIGSSDGKLLIKLNADNGDVIWTHQLSGWSWGKPVLKNGVVYIGSTGHDEPGWYITKRGFAAIDAATGKRRWQYQPNKIDGFVHGGVYASPAISAGKVIIPDLDGYIHIYEE